MNTLIVRSSVVAMSVALGLSVAVPASAQITFQDIYDNPDDQQLNLAYARQQIEAGEMADAASSLERMLFFTPDWDSARLLYATVLFDLDDRVAARRELELLRNRPLTPGQRQVAQRYLDAIDGVSSAGSGDATGLSARLVLSARYDDNAGGIFGDVVFGNQSAGDEAVGLSAGLRYTTEVDGDPNVLAFAEGTAQLRRYADVSDADFDVYGLRGGFAGQGERTEWQADLSYQDISVGGDRYLQQTGATLMFGVDVTNSVQLSLHGGWYDRNFDSTPNLPGAAGRTGDLAEVGVGVSVEPMESLRLRAKALYQTASAETAAFAYDGPRISGDIRYQFNRAAYVTGSATYRELNYDGLSVFIFPAAERQDEILSLRGAIGLKLSELTSSEFLDDVTLELGAHHTDRSTNLPNADFNNTGAELRLILDF